MAFGGTLFGGGEVDQPMLLVDGLDGARPGIIDVPGTRGEPPHETAGVVVQIQVFEAVARRRPDELVRVRQEGQLVVQFDPGVAGLGEHDPARPAVEVGEHEIQAALIAALALHGERPAVGQPVDAGEIDVGVRAEIEGTDRAAAHVDDVQAHADVGAARGGVALREGRDVVGGDLEALRHRHGALVDAHEGDVPAVGRPPVPRGAVHLFLGDELGHAVLDRAAAVAGQRFLGVPLQVVDEEVLLAHVGDPVAGGRDGGVGRERSGGGDLGHGVAGRLGEIVVEEIARGGEQQRPARRRERVFEDAGQRGRALPLAPCTLLVRQRPLRAGQVLRVHQQPRHLVVNVVFPQVQPVLVVGLALQIRDAGAVGRELHALQGGSGERRCVEQAVDGELGGVDAGHADHAGDEKVREAQVGHADSMARVRGGGRKGYVRVRR